MLSLHQVRPQDWARKTLTTIGEACRAVKADTLGRMIDWIAYKLTVEHWFIPEIKAISQKELPYSGCWYWIDQNVIFGQGGLTMSH